ncbi:hypothetical protein AX769_11285 [Frondihabitans sp. PAMC 28766]|uniref:hypothetical protein n=1 Tax=Frondihabitans sp. PAMC 28766 TaxID=1795630 RepID=UPI00078B95AD|nr:hypothetical protein [Frondihabitans sp. PAMC 28766]AMM20615.1 hypothetical protein AX769_11285 [Frondihabitans sp. PAMC 28766]
MPKYAVDPEGVEHVAKNLRLSSDYAPDGHLASAHACGSLDVETAVDAANAEFERNWSSAFEGLDSRVAGAVEAAMGYQESENRVYQGAMRQRR